jgi:hypothetical protein
MFGSRDFWPIPRWRMRPLQWGSIHGEERFSQ